MDMSDGHQRDTKLFDALRLAAPAEDAGVSLRASVETVIHADARWLNTPLETCWMLVSLAEANLPVARLVEGHVNARQLMALYAPDMNVGGSILGVWGADGDAPLQILEDVCVGTKRYASGLGTVDYALVTVNGDKDQPARLALVDVSDTRRHRPGTWTMTGMRATVSGDIDLSGLAFTWIGEAGDYVREPFFLGGVWRIAALQLGGSLGLLAAARDALAATGRLDADAQVARLSPLIGRAMAAFGLIERAAVIVSGPDGLSDPDRAIALSIQARLLTEDLAQDTIAAVERSIGLDHFATGSMTGRIARDIATYCRQAARDAFAQKAGRIILGRGRPFSELWHG